MLCTQFYFIILQKKENKNNYPILIRTLPMFFLSANNFDASTISSIEHTEWILGLIVPFLIISNMLFKAVFTFSGLYKRRIPKWCPDTVRLVNSRSDGFIFFVCHHNFNRSNVESLFLPVIILLAPRNKNSTV